MKALLIYAHPNTKGHCSEVLKNVESQLKKAKHQYELVDLYKIKYDPVLHEEEHYTAGNRKVSAQNKQFQKKITESDMLIFIYPVWWATMPAILKGWIDRVMTSHFAFRYVDGRPQGLLKDKKAIVLMTAGGPRIIYSLLANPPGMIMKRGILGFCGIKSKIHLIAGCRQLDDSKKKEIKRRVEKAFSRV